VVGGNEQQQNRLEVSAPAGVSDELKLTDVIDVKLLQQLQDTFAESYGVASLIFDETGNPITKPSQFSTFCQLIRATTDGMRRCEISDARIARQVAKGSPAVAPCENFEEILDGAVPIFIGDRHVATWGIGQRVVHELSEERVRRFAERIGADPDQLVAAARELQPGSKEQFQRAVAFLERVTATLALLGAQNRELRTLREQLETRVEERTRELQETTERLQHAYADIQARQESVLNITEDLRAEIETRMQTAVELRDSERRLSDIINFLPDATFAIDLDGRVIAWNRAIEAMTGVTSEGLRGKVDYEYAVPIYGTRRPALVDLVLRRADEIEETYALFRREGESVIAEADTVIKGRRVHLWGKAGPIYDHSGQKIGAIESIRDITEQKQVEAERERYLKELEQRAAEMERFAYTISHELRTPLITVRGYTDLLLRDLERGEREQVVADLRFIENAVTSMAQLLQDTLELSRTGRVMNLPEDVPFNALVRAALVQLTEQLKWGRFEVAVAEDFPSVHVDRQRIVEVLVNLIENSIKFMGDQPQPKIEIGYRTEDNEPVFFVKDNGIGLDKSQHEKIFQLFYKVDKKSKGSGAGLAIVKRIIEVHGGRMWLESEVGKGCTVCFTLPTVGT